MHDEDIFTSHVFLNFYKRLAIGKRADAAFTEFDADVIADGVGQRLVGGSAEYFHRLKWLVK